MHKITIIFSILIFLLLQTQLSAYAKNRNSQTMPEWVTMPSSSYPADTFFSAAGEGSDRESAELKAVQRIASLFGQNIVSVSTAKMLMEKTEKDKESTSSQSKSVSQDILQNVNQDDVIGVEIKEYWFDSVHTVWYALAVLDKQKTASLYYSMIKKNNSQIESLTGKASEKEAPLDAYGCFAFAEKIAENNDVYIKRLSVISAEGGKAMRAASVPAVELRGKMKDIAAEIPVRIDIADDTDGRVAAALAEAAAAVGLNTSGRSDIRYSITGAVKYVDTENSTGSIKFCRYTLDCTLTDMQTGKKLFPYTVEGREGAGNAVEAGNRAEKALGKKIRSDFEQAFAGYLYNQGRHD
jgi:hypothetical protein